MSKAKVRVKVKSGRPTGSGTLIARAPVTVARTESPKGPRIYGETVQITTKIRTTSRGKSRRN